MSVVSRNNERLQMEQDLQQQFENKTSEMIEWIKIFKNKNIIFKIKWAEQE